MKKNRKSINHSDRISTTLNQVSKTRIVHMPQGEVASDEPADFSNLNSEDEFSLDHKQLQQVAADSSKFLNNWHELISQTNWEKGKIICRWREQVCELYPDVKTVSDRAWSELTGGISPEHVGRLRRTFERFGDVHDNYRGLSWTHFMIAVSWSDAEMWLEGASQNSWTIEEMRKTRWEAMGAAANDKPNPADVIVEEISGDDLANSFAEKPVQQGDGDVITGPIIEGPDWGDEDKGTSKLDAPDTAAIESILKRVPDEFADAVRNLGELINDCHNEDWKSIKQRDVLKLLNFLKDQVRNGPMTF